MINPISFRIYCLICILLSTLISPECATALQADAEQTPSQRKTIGNLNTADLSNESRYALDLSPCGATGITMSDLTNSYLFVGNPQTNCTRWIGAIQGISIESTGVDIAGNLIPVVVYSGPEPASTRSNNDRTIYIHLPGGPGGGIQPTTLSVLFTNILRPSDIFISLGYTGTGYGSTYPHPDFNIAAKETTLYTNLLRARNAGAKIVLVGESLGGVIIAKAIDAKFGAMPDKVILISPPLYSPIKILNDFKKKLNILRKYDVKSPVRVFKKSSQSWQDGAFDEIYSGDLLKHFFPQSEINIDLFQRLSRNCRIPIHIIYGADDPKIGVEKIPELQQLDCVSSTRVEGMGHVVDETHFDAVDKTITEFIR